MAYRLDELTVTDREAGSLRLRGDGFAAAGEVVTLLESPDAQQFMKMSPAEISGAGDIAAAYRDALRHIYSGGNWRPPQLDPATAHARERLAADAAALLGPGRWDQLERLSWRIRGADALIDDRLAAELSLTDDQQARLREAARQNEEEQARVLQSISAVRLRDRRRLEDRGTQADSVGQQQMLSVLSPQQRERFTRLLGSKR